LAEEVIHREWQAPSDRRRFTGVKSIEWRGRDMKFQPFVGRISLFILVVCAALSVLVGAIGAQEKPTANDKAASGARFPAKKLVSATAAVDANEDSKKEKEGKIDEDGPDAIRKREEWFYKQRAFPNTTLPTGARFRAFQHRQRMLEAEGKLVRRMDGTLQASSANITLGSNWTSLGPKPTTGGFFSPVSGRITAIAVDPSDATGNTVLIGGAQGGIWRSVDAGATWTAVGDTNASLAMGSIAFAPGAPATVYAGTGEQASVGFDVYYGAGVLKSMNGGVTWTQTCTVASPTCPFIGPFDIPNFGFGFFNDGGARISYVSVNPANANLVLAGAQIPRAGVSETAGGIYCSDDGGATWSGLLVGGAGSFVGFANATTAYAAIGRPGGNTGATPNGIYKSINADGGTTKKCSSITFSATTTQPTAGTMGRIDLGVFDANTVYASVANGAVGSTTNLGVWVTTNGGTTWTPTSAPDICQRQCWYDNVVKVDPYNKDIVFLGGAAAVAAGPIYQWVMRSMNGTTGGTFSPAIPTVSGSPGLPHVDVHALAFVKLPSTKVRVYLGNDGGLWRSEDAEAAAVAWANLNQNLSLTQFYPGLSFSSANPNLLFGGAQDNGSQFYSGIQSWVDNRQCGDGGATTVDPNIPTVVYATCQNININVSLSGGQDPNSFVFAINGINPNGTDAVNFIPPIAADASTAGRAYFGTDHIYQTNNFGTTWTAISGALPGANAYLTTVASAPKNPAVVYAGSNTGLVFVARNVTAGGLANFAQITTGTLPPRTVTAVVPDPNDPTGITAYVTFSGFAVSTDTKGHIFKTTNGGTSWTDVSCSVASCITPAATDLPNIPVNDLVVDPQAAGTLYAATDLGVFATIDGGATWSTLNSGLPNVAVLSMKLHDPSRTLLATTHGRGAWSVVLSNFTFPGVHIGALTPTTANAGAATATIVLDGSGLAGGTVMWDGSATNVTTTNTTNTQAQATMAASLLTGGGTHQITVSVGPATSNALIFSVLGGAPTITNSTPPSALVNSAATTITVTGTNFGSTSKVLMNPDVGGTAIPTTFVNSTQLTATVPATFMANFGSTNSVGVQNPPPGGGTTVTTATITLPTFKVVAPAPANDNFASAINITVTSFTDTKDSSGATTETNDPTPVCAQSPQIPFVTGRSNTIWYKVVPTGSGTANIDTIGSSYDSVLSVWAGTSQTALTAVPNGCNDDINPGIVTQSQLTNVALNVGTTYFIMVSSFGQADPNPLAFGGKSVLNFSCTCTIASGTGSFTIGGSAATVTAGASGTSTITVTPTGGFTGTVNVTCPAAGLPAGVTCSPNPLAINVTSAAAATAQLTVNVAAPSTTLTASAPPLEHTLYASGVMPSGGSKGWWTLSAGTGLAAILLLFLPGRKRYRKALGLGLVCVLSFALGCGGGGGGGGPVATVTQLTVTAPTKVASGAGNTFAFTVSVTGGTPTGQVQLFDGSTALGTAATVSGGSASITSNGLPVGTHAISAHYLGTASTLASQSGPLNVTVTGTTTFAITGTPAASNGSPTVSITIN
jgi:hypothetical protein